MKHTKKYIALCLAMALGCLAVLTACSSDKSTSQTQSTGTPSSQAASGSTQSTEAQKTVMGEVTYVGSSYISVTAYTGGEDVTDFTTLDISTLTATENTESIDTAEDTEYLKVETGMLNAAARDDVTTGAFIVSTLDENGAHQIILIESGDAAGADASSASTGAASASTSDGEAADGADSASADDSTVSGESSTTEA